MLKRLKETHAHPFNMNLSSNYYVPGIVADPGGFSSTQKCLSWAIGQYPSNYSTT